MILIHKRRTPNSPDQNNPFMSILPPAERNKEPILTVLRTTLPETGVVLETNSGRGIHAVHFAAAFPALSWRPSDIDASALDRLRALTGGNLANDNLLAPLELDVTQTSWPLQSADAIVSINMIHIAPWAACEGLFAGAARILPQDGVLYLYGPFILDSRPTAPGNLAFDAELRGKNPAWGIRNLDAIDAVAQQNDLVRTETIDMPANNYSLIFRKQTATP
jgi:hypothetical protein